MGNRLSERVARARRIGERIFGIRVPFLLVGNSSAYDSPQQAYIKTLGRYDFQNDIVRIYAKRVQSYCKKYKIDLESSLIHPICHELGHAKEARLFEESGIFPYTFYSSSLCRVQLNSHWYLLDDVKIGGRGLFKVFLLGIQDYSVERELQKHGIKDPFAKVRIWNIQEREKYVHLPEPRHQLAVEALSLLPLDLCYYVYGGLSQEEQLYIENYHKNLIGDKWHSGLRVIHDLQFGNAKRYVDTVRKLFKRILGLNVILVENHRTELFEAYRHIPQFWNKKSYRVFSVQPSLETMG